MRESILSQKEGETKNINSSLAIMVWLLGVAAMVVGAVFIGQGVSKYNRLIRAMQTEEVVTDGK